jgi:hypothetical protein
MRFWKENKRNIGLIEMKTNKEEKILSYGQLKVKHNHVTYFLIGLAGAIVFICLFNMIIWVNNIVTQFNPLFILVSLVFSVMFTAMDATIMAILLQYHYGKY